MATGPSPAERARTALAGATAATLATRGCPAPQTLTVVSIEDQPDGRPLVWLDRQSPVTRLLAACPVATLSISGPRPYRALALTGPMQPCRSDRNGQRAYRLAFLSARLVGATSVPIPLRELMSAEPDPLRAHEAAMLHHLETAHSADLLACTRAQGHDDVHAAVPRAIDRYGVELAALRSDGVRLLRLDFPDGPVDRLDRLTTGLRYLLTCRCGDGPSR